MKRFRQSTGVAVLYFLFLGLSAHAYDGPRQSWVKDVHNQVDASVCLVHEHAVGQADGFGAGVVVDSQAGLVLTAYHVVDGLKHIGLTFGGSSTFTTASGEIVWKKPKADLALVRIVGKRPVLTEARIVPGDLEVGDDVVAIGNPWGLIRSTTVGHVSRIEDTVFDENVYKSCIQTDAAVNPGNSGGGLFDRKGGLVGIVIRKIPAWAASNIGWASNIDVAEAFLAQESSARKVSGVEHGVTTQYKMRWHKDTNQAEVMRRQGVFVKSVSGPAVKLLKKGDKLLSVTTTDHDQPVVHPVRNQWDFERAFLGCSPEEKVVVRVERGGKEVSLTITLAGPGLEADGSVKPAPDDDDWYYWY